MAEPDTTKAPDEGEEGGRTATVGADRASRREQRRLLQHDLGRRQLLDAAEEVFAAKGFHDTTLKEVAERAEFSVGSVYSFFENKDDLYANVFLRRGAAFLPGMREVLASTDDALDALHRLVDFQVGFFRQHPHFARLYLRSPGTVQAAPLEPLLGVLRENFDDAMRMEADLFRRGQDEGRLREGDPLVLARLFSALVGAYQASDPAVVHDEPRVERMPLAALHAIVDGAFAA